MLAVQWSIINLWSIVILWKEPVTVNIIYVRGYLPEETYSVLSTQNNASVYSDSYNSCSAPSSSGVGLIWRQV